MKCKMVFAIVFFALLLTACGNAEISEVNSYDDLNTNVSSIAVEEGNMGESSTDVSEESSLMSSDEKNEDMPQEAGGTYAACGEHMPSYHSVNINLMNYVGQDVFDEWYENCNPWDEYGRPTEDFTIVAFVEYFDIPREVFQQCIHDWASDDRIEALGVNREEYLLEIGYTDEQIDAIYSGDQAEINRAFCGDMAYYNEEDGQLYSIYWLSDHTAEDYAEAELPVEEVQRILELAQSAGSSYAMLAEEAASTVEEFEYMKANIAE